MQCEADVTIINALGLHARAAAKLVALASRYESEVLVIRGDKRVNAKSIMGVMMLAAAQGTELKVVINGDDAEAAMLAIQGLIENRFGEDQ
ncbi:MAG: phosphocarrier protein HPr [Lysobacteraceae bacterium]|nr:MAG: phosphocarrier protein HPr [Xanthomonadaceae bacterium]